MHGDKIDGDWIEIYTDRSPKSYDLAGFARSLRQGGFAEQVPRLLWRLGNSSKLDCARLRPQFGVGQACKRGFAASNATDSDANASADSIRCRIVYSYLKNIHTKNPLGLCFSSEADVICTVT